MLRARSSAPHRSAQRACLLVAAGLLCGGCIKATFVKSSSTFTEHKAAVRPEVYVDHLPKKPYESVGIIEVTAKPDEDLAEIMSAAADKGEDVGCDLVVDRAIHKVDVIVRKRWTVTVWDPPREPSQHSWRRDAEYFGQAAPAPVVVPPLQPLKREFICGVWTEASE